MRKFSGYCIWICVHLASLVFSRINRPEPSQTIIQNFPYKICIQTKKFLQKIMVAPPCIAPSNKSSIDRLFRIVPWLWSLSPQNFELRLRDSSRASHLPSSQLFSSASSHVCVLCTLTDRCRGNWIRDQVLNRHMILTFGLTSYIISRPSWINAPWGGKLPAGQDKGLLISLDIPWAAT